MQYQIQQIRQHFTSIDSKFRRLPAFVIRRQLFSCRSQSPSFYKLRSQTVYNPLNMSCSPAKASVTFGSPTPPQQESSEKQQLKLTRVHGTHEKIMSQSQERFYQRRISEKNEKSQKQQSSRKEQASQPELVSTTPFNKLNMAKVNEYKQSPGSNRYGESKNSYTDRPEGSVPVGNEVKEILDQYKKEDAQEQQQNIELQNSQQEESLKDQGLAFTLHACDPNNSYKVIMSRKSGNKHSTKKSPTKTPKSPKKQHIIYYNQIYLYKPRQQSRLSSSKQSYYSNRQISPRKQSKLQSCILTTPSKRNTCPPPQPEEEIEVINLAPEFSKLI